VCTQFAVTVAGENRWLFIDGAHSPRRRGAYVAGPLGRGIVCAELCLLRAVGDVVTIEPDQVHFARCPLPVGG